MPNVVNRKFHLNLNDYVYFITVIVHARNSKLLGCVILYLCLLHDNLIERTSALFIVLLKIPRIANKVCIFISHTNCRNVLYRLFMIFNDIRHG